MGQITHHTVLDQTHQGLGRSSLLQLGFLGNLDSGQDHSLVSCFFSDRINLDIGDQGLIILTALSLQVMPGKGALDPEGLLQGEAAARRGHVHVVLVVVTVLNVDIIVVVIIIIVIVIVVVIIIINVVCSIHNRVDD